MTQPEPIPPAPVGPEPLPALPRRTFVTSIREYFVDDAVTLLSALVPTCLLSMVLYTRHPATNFIFDEQEALLANPYVRAASEPSSGIGWLQAFTRDFWGLTPERTIGSYRPIPDLVWRLMWKVGAREQSAFPHAYMNVLLHGLNGALVVLIVLRWTRDRLAAWLAGAVFVATAVVTEAVSGVVGLADVLGGTGALLALLALGGSLWTMPVMLLGATWLGLYSKESALCIVPLVPVAALLLAPFTHPERPLRWARAGVAALVVGSAFVFYVEARRRLFPVDVPKNLTAEANAGSSALHRAFVAALRWYAQPMLPHDPLNNPLINASPPYRVAGALRVYVRGLAQIVFPATLSGDYSAPQEPIPDRLVFPESVLGALGMILPLAGCVGLGLLSRARSSARFAVAAFALAWIVVSYVPVSNVFVLLPTVRAERFWYFPAIGSAMLLAMAFSWALRRAEGRARTLVVGGIAVFLGFQGAAARRHAFDYKNDLVFWDATRKAVPRSAKAHLNYSVMLGARSDLPGRLRSNDVALALAPEWPMANVYEGDTLCRMHRAQEAMPHYLRGFELAPNDLNLVALGLQCLWDEQMLSEDAPARGALQDLADEHPGSWLKYLVDDTFSNGEDYKGVNPKYRPRGYNEGPKKDG